MAKGLLAQVTKVAAVAENGGASHIKREGGSGGVRVKEEEGDRKRRRNRWGEPATPVVKQEAPGKPLPTHLFCLGSRRSHTSCAFPEPKGGEEELMQHVDNNAAFL
jgi:hypothetical protein